MVALQQGDAERAVKLIGQAIKIQSKNPGFHANLAQAYLALNRAGDAHESFRHAARLDPGNPHFAASAAHCLALMGRLEEAERQLRRVLQQHPGHASAWFNLGRLLADQGRHQEAVDCQRRSTQLDPEYPDGWNELGRSLHALEQFDEAERMYHHHLALQPDSAKGYCNLASVLTDNGRFSEAAAICRQGIERSGEPGGQAMLHLLLGSALVHEGRLVAALPALRAATELAPDNPRMLWAYGYALSSLGAPEGLPWLERALALDPSSSESRYGAATQFLGMGEFQAGWRDYESRPARTQKVAGGIGSASAIPGDLSGKKIHLLAEQGLGDQLFFLRFAQVLKSRGAQITCVVSAKIASMLERVPVLDRVISQEGASSAADWTVPMGSLPFLLSRPESSPCAPRENAGSPRAMRFAHHLRVFFPALPPALTLTPLPERLHAIQERLAKLGPPPYIGLTWRGGTPPTEQRGAFWALHKEIALAELGAAMRGVKGTLIALQRNPQPGEIEQLNAAAGHPVHDLCDLNEDLESMLALLALIDDYAGVSNTNMHLRAGSGRTARVLVPQPAEWRWMIAGDESPWFPGFRVYRQKPDGDWGAALERLAVDLADTHSRR